MLRLSLLLLAAAILGLGLSFDVRGVAAAEVGSPSSAATDLYTVGDVRIDATAGSAVLARDAAMAQGRVEAWGRIFKRVAPTAQLGKQPQLSDNQLIRLVRSFEVSNERRSTTRYLADVTYHFNPAAVRLALRQASIPYTDTKSKPVLIVPLIEGKRFDPASPWAAIWKDPSYAQGLVPLIPAIGDSQDQAILSREDLSQADWTALEPLATRYDAREIVLAIASEDGNTVQVIELSPMTRVASAFAFAQSTFKADADAIAEKVTDAWKGRNSVDFGTRGRLVADVQFDSLEQWARIRTQLRAVRSVAAVDVVGIASNEAEIDVSYFGRVEQLKDALQQQDLTLAGPPSSYSIQNGRASAANTP